MKALPYREVFITHLQAGNSEDSETVTPVSTQHYEQAILADIETYIVHLDRVLVVLADYYLQHSLDSNECV